VSRRKAPKRAEASEGEGHLRYPRNVPLFGRVRGKLARLLQDVLDDPALVEPWLAYGEAMAAGIADPSEAREDQVYARYVTLKHTLQQRAPKFVEVCGPHLEGWVVRLTLLGLTGRDPGEPLFPLFHLPGNPYVHLPDGGWYIPPGVEVTPRHAMEIQQYQKAFKPAGKPGPKPASTPAPKPSPTTAPPRVRDAALARQAHEMHERRASYWAIADALFPSLSLVERRSGKMQSRVKHLIQNGRRLA
jgi:hypothetical protein